MCVRPRSTVLTLQMDNTVVVTDYRQMDKILQEERKYILNLVKTIKKSGCNVLLIQKCVKPVLEQR